MQNALCRSHRRALTKLLLIMKFTAIFLFVACITAGAKGFTQNISISEKNVPIEKVFKAIEKQTSFTFWYNVELLKDAKKVTVIAKNSTVEDVLKQCFAEQPLTYSIVGNTIIVKVKTNSPNADGGSEQLPPPIDITGKVTDADGNPLAGATVKVTGTSKGTTTNNDGVFVLKGVDDNATLEISFVGYETYTVAVANKTSIVASLKIKPESLNEVIINKGYYTEKQKLSTGSVSTVTSKDIAKQPVNNPLLALQGRVPGLLITQSSGVPGSGITVRIEGQNSLSKGNDPLYVIDGVPFTSQLPSTLGSILGSNGGGLGSPFSFINPSDIESISVLKDADATSIYGSRASNGAILITTKKGQGGRTKVDVNVQTGWGMVTRMLKLLNTNQYLEMRHEALNNDGAVADINYDFDLLVWDTTRNTDWQKELIGKTAHYTDVQTSISGGSANTNFLVGFGYHRETTVFPGDLSDQKGSVHFNINHISTNQKFRLQMTGSYLADYNRLMSNDLTYTAINTVPNAPSLYNSDGTLNWAPLPNGSSTLYNPLANLYNKYNYNTKNLVSSVLMEYQILTGLSIKSSFGYTNLQTNETQIYPLLSTSPDNRPYSTRYAIFANNNINSWNIEPQVSYKHLIGIGTMEALLGTTILQRNSVGQQYFGVGFNSDQVMEDIKSAPSVSVNSSINSVYRYDALFGRLNYNVQNKYIVNLTGRRDGSSRFGSNNLFHDFWSIAGGWLFSNEQFFKKNLSLLSYGKLRASYGTTGNDQIGDYQFLNLYNPYGVPVTYQGTTGLLPNVLPNPYLQWEETKKLQFGLELGFLKDRILFSGTYYLNRSSNQLTGYALPYTTGFSQIVENLPAKIKNWGWEFSLNTFNVRNKTFVWNSNINLTIPKNELDEFPNFANSSAASVYAIGAPITLRKVFPFVRVDPTTGLYQFSDTHGNVTPSPNNATDRTVLVNTSPKFFGGLQNDFQYKGFELDLLFEFVKKTAFDNYFLGNLPGSFYSDAYNIAYGNQPTFVLNRWQKPGDIKPVQKFSAFYPSVVKTPYRNAGSSELVTTDASYIRLKNLSLSWMLPKTLFQKIHLQNCRFYVQGQNLMIITKYKGLDPENESTLSIPPLKVIKLGIQIGL